MVLCIVKTVTPIRLREHGWSIPSAERRSSTARRNYEYRRVGTTPSLDNPATTPSPRWAVRALTGWERRPTSRGSSRATETFPPQNDFEHDTPPQPIAVQGGAAYSTTNVVFSVADVQVVKPELPQGGSIGLASSPPVGSDTKIPPPATPLRIGWPSSMHPAMHRVNRTSKALFSPVRGTSRRCRRRRRTSFWLSTVANSSNSEVDTDALYASHRRAAVRHHGWR